MCLISAINSVATSPKDPQLSICLSVLVPVTCPPLPFLQPLVQPLHDLQSNGVPLFIDMLLSTQVCRGFAGVFACDLQSALLLLAKQLSIQRW